MCVHGTKTKNKPTKETHTTMINNINVFVETKDGHVYGTFEVTTVEPTLPEESYPKDCLFTDSMTVVDMSGSSVPTLSRHLEGKMFQHDLNIYGSDGRLYHADAGMKAANKVFSLMRHNPRRVPRLCDVLVKVSTADMSAKRVLLIMDVIPDDCKYLTPEQCINYFTSDALKSVTHLVFSVDSWKEFLDSVCYAAPPMTEAYDGKRSVIESKLQDRFIITIVQCPCFHTGLGNLMVGTPLVLPPIEVMIELKSDQSCIQAIASSQDAVVTSEGSIRLKVQAGKTITGSFFGTKTGDQDVVFTSSIGEVGETMMFVWDDKTVLQSAKENESIFLVGRALNQLKQHDFDGVDAHVLGTAIMLDTKHPLVSFMQNSIFAEIERIQGVPTNRPTLNRLSSAANVGMGPNDFY